MKKKILPLKKLLPILESYRKAGKKIVTTNGSFDLFHYGHIATLEKSKKKGDILVVGINSDKSVRSYKSADRPIVPEKYRSGLLAALECVDYVFLFDELDPKSFIDQIKPDIHTNSAEYGKNPIEKETVLKNKGKLVVIDKIDGISTNKIIEKILKIYGKQKPDK
jgi:rfaE bifunctional protein nucleotidyltransferase chain/domain